MPLTEKISQEDLILYEILKNPVLCSEFVYNLDKLEHEKRFKWTDYQRGFLCDFSPYVSIASARAVGKSEVLCALIFWLLVMNIFPNDYIIYTVPNKVHLDPVFNKLTRSFRSNSLLKQFIDPKGGINGSEYSVKLNNGALLLCRIAGTSGTGANVIGLHSPFEILDESGYYPWGTWLELQPTLNTFTPGYRLIVSGVPSGLRERNVCYHCDMENSSYTKHRITALQNPRFSDDDLQRALDQYGGEDSEDYIHLVLGQHGKPLFSLFDRSLFDIESYPVYQLVLEGKNMGDDLTAYSNKLALLPAVPDRSHDVIFGVDLGYTEPTAIVILYCDKNGRIRFHGRIRMNSVSLGIQDRLIDFLDTKFSPIMIGIDAGGLGKPIVQRMIDSVDYIHKDYSKKVVPVVFQSDVVLGLTAEGEELKQKAKPLAVSVLQEYSNNHKIIYSYKDLEMVTELERMTYTKNPSGEISYRTLTERGGKKGEDHFTSGLLCGVLAHYLRNESLNLYKERKKLISPSWFVGENYARKY